MTSYFRGIPDDLVEAAVVDGLDYGAVFRKIAMPLAVPAVITVIVLQFIQIWDDLLVGLLFIQDPNYRT
ncbi:MAG: ABC transporter permease subunit, partial [Actinobacteria bacterium]|nr:ABC transporter permease subunit [Actinomycetota bacterium]